MVRRPQPVFFTFIKVVSDITGWIAASLCGSVVFVMFVVMMLQVFARSLGVTISWTEEVARYLLIWVGLLAAGIALREGGHAAIGFIVDRFPKKVQMVFSLFIECSILVFIVIFFWTSLKVAVDAQDFIASSFEMSMMWPKLALPVGSVIMIVNTLYLIAFDVTALMGVQPEGTRP
jgi:TRAP-type C4-dicarboxylate transport system permease small subunit